MTACPGCGRATPTIWGKCPECGSIKDEGFRPPARKLRGPSISDWLLDALASRNGMLIVVFGLLSLLYLIIR